MEIQPEAEEAHEEEDDHEDEIAVKGKTTAADVLGWGIAKEELDEILGVSIENENMTIRDLCSQNGLSFSEVKEEVNSLLDQ